jgi:hypothetical protein
VSDFEEMLKDLFLIVWCLYITVMTLKGFFDAESFLDVMVGTLVWMFMIIIPVGIRGR